MSSRFGYANQSYVFLYNKVQYFWYEKRKKENWTEAKNENPIHPT
jgi:hypothetical protein